MDKDRVILGCEKLLNFDKGLITGRQLGIVTNHSGVLPGGVHIVDALRADPDIDIRALFSPEHGIRGAAPAGKHVANGIDSETGIPIYSLYGEHNKPDAAMLEGIQTLVYDIQDVGVRFYTYISTLALLMETAAETGIQLIILDRPMVLPGTIVDGPMLEDDVRSFVGMLPLPVLYGLTPGELARLIRKEYLGRLDSRLDMKTMTLGNYSRSMWYDQTGLSWLPPSPNIPTIDTAVIYPGAALIEGTNLSEGRGTSSPFKVIGAPFIDKFRLADLLNSSELPGLEFLPADFTPREMSIVSHPRFKNELCHGIEIVVKDRDSVRPVEMGIALVAAIRKLFGAELCFRADGAFDRLIGNKKVREMIERGADYGEIPLTWHADLAKFSESRSEYFLY